MGECKKGESSSAASSRAPAVALGPVNERTRPSQVGSLAIAGLEHAERRLERAVGGELARARLRGRAGGGLERPGEVGEPLCKRRGKC